MTEPLADPGDLGLSRLNEPQARAVAHAYGPLIVFAGAGSGKTRVITYRIANLVATHEVPPYRILAVTFTNKAAGEMRERLDKILGPEITRELWIGTFHAVCVRLIRRYHEAIGMTPNFSIYDDSDQKAVMKRVLNELQLDDRRFPPAQVLGRIAREKQEARGPEDFVVDNYFDEMTLKCFEAYQKRLVEANAVDFTDLLLLVLRLAEYDPGAAAPPDPTRASAAEHLTSRFGYVLVDEFQDVNLVQYRLVRALAGTRKNICVVGDDDQSIYRWRGADVRNIRNFTTDYPDAELVKLEQNYRSSQNVVGAALGIIRHASERQPKELWTDNDAGDPVRIVHSANERDEAAFVVGGVKKSIEDGISPREIAIFYRVHAQSRVLEEVMRQANIPYQIVGGTKFFDRAEIKDVLSYLRVAANPASDVDLLRIINKPPRKIGKTTIGRLTELASQRGGSLFESIEPLCQTDRLGSAAKKNLRAFKKLMDDLVRQAATGGPKDVADAVIADSGYVDYLKKQDNAEADARLDNLDELLGSIAEYEEEASYADEPATVADYLTRVSLLAGADTMADVERVAMMTVHAAKGLEFDVVFVTGLEEKLFPLRGQQPGEEEELEEERRLAYVAVTRARQQLYLVHTNTRTIYGQMRYNQPARFLDQIPPAHQERIATPALHDLSRQFTRTGSVSHRDHIRAGIGRDESRQNALGRRRSLQPDVSRPRVPARKAGERYVERDADVEYDDDFDSLDRFSARVGMNVRHPKFGVGQVQQIAGGGDPVCVVRFDGWGDKRIKLSFLSPA